MRYNIMTVFNPADVGAEYGLGDIISPVGNSLRRLGHEASYSRNVPSRDCRNIVFGIARYNSIGASLNKDDIIVNMEQYSPQSLWFSPEYIEVLKNFEVWDYSRRNKKLLKALHQINSKILELGFDPEQECLRDAEVQDIDVLFYGSLNPRRLFILKQLMDDGLKVAASACLYGKERDELIVRSKIVLNVHFYELAVLETARLSYLWSNHKAVVSETGADTYPRLRQACRFCEYDELRDAVHALLNNEQERLELGERGYKAFKTRSMDECLEELIGRG